MSFIPFQNWITEVVKGNIPNHKQEILRGTNVVIGITAETVWPFGGIVTFPTSAATVTLSSNSALDTLAGTGAQKVLIRGLDANRDQIFETVDLNGLTGVSTINSYLRINQLRVTQAGSLLNNQGRIFSGIGTITAGEPATVFNLIEINDAISQSAFISIPDGHRGLIYDARVGVDTGKAVEVNPKTLVGGVLINTGSIEIASPLLSLFISEPRLIDENADFRIDAFQTSGGGGNSVVQLNAGLIIYKINA